MKFLVIAVLVSLVLTDAKSLHGVSSNAATDVHSDPVGADQSETNSIKHSASEEKGIVTVSHRHEPKANTPLINPISDVDSGNAVQHTDQTESNATMYVETSVKPLAEHSCTGNHAPVGSTNPNTPEGLRNDQNSSDSPKQTPTPNLVTENTNTGIAEAEHTHRDTVIAEAENTNTGTTIAEVWKHIAKEHLASNQVADEKPESSISSEAPSTVKPSHAMLSATTLLAAIRLHHMLNNAHNAHGAMAPLSETLNCPHNTKKNNQGPVIQDEIRGKEFELETIERELEQLEREAEREEELTVDFAGVQC